MKSAQYDNYVRTEDQIHEQYLIEKELAARLRNASADERRGLYSSVYDELYRRVPHHPQLTRKTSQEATSAAVAPQLRFLRRYLSGDTVFIEIGAGDCALSIAVAPLVRHVYAIDVSDIITRNSTIPENFELIISDGCSIPVQAGAASVAYSNQLMEHLHPDDARTQLENIYEALSPGGAYVCVTPNRISGPHDISKGYDTTATGFHLKEYSIYELSGMLRSAGFSRVRRFIRIFGRFTAAPVWPFAFIEHLVEAVPIERRRTLLRRHFWKSLLSVRLVAIK